MRSEAKETAAEIVLIEDINLLCFTLTILIFMREFDQVWIHFMHEAYVNSFTFKAFFFVCFHILYM